MPCINLQITKGSTREQKRKLVEDFTASLVSRLGKKPEHIHVVIDEVDEENWGYAGMLTDEYRARASEAEAPSPDQPMRREALVLHRADWAGHETLWKGVIEGRSLGTGVTVLFYATEEVGVGPKWHVHTYDELFIVRSGRALFTVGDQKIEARAGDVLLGPANVPHKYHNRGPGLLETTDIHLSDRWTQVDLEDPELAAG